MVGPADAQTPTASPALGEDRAADAGALTLQAGQQRVFAKVFTKDGSRFLIPGMYYFEDDHDASPANVIINAMMYGVVLHMTVEPDWLEFTTTNGEADIRNRPMRLCGPQFAHGAIDVWVIDGPLLDDAPSDDDTSVADTASIGDAGRAGRTAEQAPEQRSDTQPSPSPSGDQ